MADSMYIEVGRCRCSMLGDSRATFDWRKILKTINDPETRVILFYGTVRNS